MALDLFLFHRSFEHQTSDRMEVDLNVERGDLQLTGGREALAQAVLNRLFTRLGELDEIGHPDYGSRLYLLAGEPNTARTRALAGLYIRESLAWESEIEEILSIDFPPVAARFEKRRVLEVRIVIRPLGGSPLALSLGVNLEA